MVYMVVEGSQNAIQTIAEYSSCVTNQWINLTEWDGGKAVDLRNWK